MLLNDLFRSNISCNFRATCLWQNNVANAFYFRLSHMTHFQLESSRNKNTDASSAMTTARSVGTSSRKPRNSCSLS